MKPSELKGAYAPIPDDCYRAMKSVMDNMREEPVMKKKYSTALVILVVIVIAAAAAIAVTYWHSTAEDVALMEAEKGYFEDWTAGDKATLVRMLNEAGALPDSPALDELLLDSTTAQRKGELADTVMTAWMQRPAEQVSLISILETMRGSFGSWTAEDKVWYNDMLARLGMLGEDHTEYAVPENEEITQDEAVRIAKETFQEAYGVSMEELDAFEVMPTFMAVNWEPGENEPYGKGDRIWSVILILTDPDDHGKYTSYHTDISADGEVLSYTYAKDGVRIHSTYE